ncbi:Opioid growth factor receptor [Balamuthia mandrillaris]
MDVEEQQPNASMKEERATEEQVVATNSTTSTDHMVETSQRPASDTGDPATTGGSTEEKDGKHSITLLASNGTDPSASSNTSNSVGVTVLPIAAGIGMSPLRAHLAGNKMGGSFANVLFYRNVLPSSPSGDFIDNIHSHWKGKYSFLEAHHGYIQWLFPLFEGTGLNSSAQKLNKEEAKMMREDLAMAKRLVKSYQLMLHFYGMRLADKRTGRIIRRKNYAPRYSNLNTHSHNFLRITRILTSLGHLGFIRYKEAWLRFLSEEIGKEGLLPECSYALHNFWLPLLDVENPSFIEKTGETAEDRTESVYFEAMEQSDWQDSDKEEESEEELGVEEGDAMQESSSSAARMSIAMQSGSSSQEMTSSSTPPVATRESATNTPTQGRGGRKRASMGERKSRMRGGKICAYCGATETPEWRSGPEGKQTLCNSCGLYYSRHGTLNGRDGQPRHSVSRATSSPLGSGSSPSSSAASFASSLRGLAGSATFIAGGPEGSQQITSLAATSPLPARSANGRVCVECKTTETPEWRSGPEGKHTLCNRCGLHYARNKRLKEMGGTPRTPRKRTRVVNNNHNNTKETNQLIGTAGMPLAPLNVMSLPGVVALPSASSTSSSISTSMPATAPSNLASIPAPKHETEEAAPTDAPQPQSVGDRSERGEDTNSAGLSSSIQQHNATKVEELRGEESAAPPASTGIGVAESSSGGSGASNGSSSAGGVLLSAPAPATNINPYVVDYKQRLQSRSCGFCGTRDTPNWRSGRTAAEMYNFSSLVSQP